MVTHGADDRALFESEGTALYDEIVTSGGLASTDARLQEGGDLYAALDLLARLGLVQLTLDGTQWGAEDPAIVQSRVIGPLTTEGARLLGESAQWASAFGAITHAWRRAPHSVTSDAFTYLHDTAIDPYLAGLVAECEEEMLTAQPQATRKASALPTVVLRDAALVERGATIRTLYQHSARRDSTTRKYVAAVTERGAEVRTLDEFFNRMIIFDRRIAVIPSKDTMRVALVIREPSVVTYLVDVFERAWERARPFTSHETSTMRDIASEQRAMTLRMLIEGHSDPVSAKRLGVSPRTYAGYVADLKEEFESETRFQLGYELGRRGLSGIEDGPTGD